MAQNLPHPPPLMQRAGSAPRHDKPEHPWAGRQKSMQVLILTLTDPEPDPYSDPQPDSSRDLDSHPHTAIQSLAVSNLVVPRRRT